MNHSGSTTPPQEASTEKPNAELSRQDVATDPLPGIGKRSRQSSSSISSKDLDESAGSSFLDFLLLPEHPHLVALRNGVISTVPLLLIAAIFILINNFPLQGYQELMTATFGPKWKEPGILVFTGTIGILSLVVTYSLSTSLIDLDNRRHPDEDEISHIIGALVAFVCFFLIANPELTEAGLVMKWAGIQGMLTAAILSFLSTGIFLKLCRTRWLRVFFYGENSDPLLPSLFETLLPAMGTIVLFLFIRQLLTFLGIESLNQVVYDALRLPFVGAQDSFSLGALYTLLVQGCWFFGIHGPNLLDPITHEIFTQGMAANIAAANSGQPPQHIFTKYLFDVFIYMGGSGGTLGLILAIFIRSRDNTSRRIASLSIVPGLFNINELVLFGLPIVYNPIYLIPFCLVPLVLLTISYFAISTGIIPPPVYNVDWTTPPVISALISTNSWKGVVLQMLNLAVSTAIYLPFVGLANKHKKMNRQKVFEDLLVMAAEKSCGPKGKRLIDRPGEAGAMARSLANDLLYALQRPTNVFFLHYQPRVNLVSKSVPCVEALLRWQHPEYGPIPPVLALTIADDTDLRHQMDDFILIQAMKQQRTWYSEDIMTIMSINLSESQLQDASFPARVQTLLTRFELPPDSIQMEAHEDLALDPDGRYNTVLEALHHMGARLAVDDFGKSYRVLSQIRRLPIGNLQIDQNLIRNVDKSAHSQDVVGSIQEMSLNMGFNTSAEYVENSEQLEMLLELNFSTFQGHLFATAMPPEQCAEFIRNFRGESRMLP